MCQGDVLPDMTIPEVIERVKHNFETLVGALDNAERVARARRRRVIARDLDQLRVSANDLLVRSSRLFSDAAAAAADSHEHKGGC